MRFKSYYQSQYQSKANYHEHLLSIFDSSKNAINELEDVRSVVLDTIKKDKWETDPTAFYHSLRQSKHPKMLTDYTVEDLSKMKCFKLSGFNIGFALKNFEDKGTVEIVAVHNNELIKNIGEPLMKAAISKGGRYLDHFDGFLSNFYEKLGFKEYKRDPYNPDYDPNGEFASRYGKQPVIYRKLGESRIREDDESLGAGFFGTPEGDSVVTSAPTGSKELSPSERRREVLLKIKSGELEASHYPTIFKKFVDLMDMTGKIKIPDTSYGRGLATKLTKFIMTGKLGDALASHSMKEVMNIVKGAAAEIARKLRTDHPNRDLASLAKRGVIDEIIRFWIKENNYDLFHDEWVMKLYPLIHREVMEIRKSGYKKAMDV